MIPTWARQVFLDEGSVLANLVCIGELREDIGMFIRNPWNMGHAELLKLVD